MPIAQQRNPFQNHAFSVNTLLRLLLLLDYLSFIEIELLCSFNGISLVISEVKHLFTDVMHSHISSGVDSYLLTY